MRITVLVEDYSGYESPFLAQHGVSFLVEKDGKRILFDTGHCTGLRAESAFLEAYGGRFHKLHSGMVMEFEGD